MRNATRMHKEPMRSASFVCSRRLISLVLVELGYVTNKADLKSMTSDGWRGQGH